MLEEGVPALCPMRSSSSWRMNLVSADRPQEGFGEVTSKLWQPGEKAIERAEKTVSPKQ